MITLKSNREIREMRKAGQVVARALELVGKHIKPGLTTAELDKLVEDFICTAGANPAFKGYQDYPASICASLNEEVVHGIPGERELLEGDIISVDIGAELNGFYGDAAKTFAVGEICPEAERLLDVTEQALYKGIDVARMGARLSDISHAIQTYVEANGFSVVKDYVGHGIGRAMHEAPQVPNFGPPNRGVKLRPGLTIALEPMVNMGSYHVKTLGNGWTVVTTDGSLSAHFEHSICVTESKPEILTVV